MKAKTIRVCSIILLAMIIIQNQNVTSVKGAETLDVTTLKIYIQEIEETTQKLSRVKKELKELEDKLIALDASIKVQVEALDQLNEKSKDIENFTNEDGTELKMLTYVVGSYRQEYVEELSKVEPLKENVEVLEAELKDKTEQMESYRAELDKSKKTSPTLNSMIFIDYITDSITGLSDKAVDLKTLRTNLYSVGKLIGQGMPYETYEKAMSYEWKDQTDYTNEPIKMTIDLEKSMDYDFYVNVLKKLSRYDGVYLYDIGQSTQGRRMYAIEIDIPSDQDKKVIMLTGQTHSREFAGGVYILKQLNDLLLRAQTNQSTRKLLEGYKFVAVPIISLDVREGLIKEPQKWTIGKEKLWKAYANGIDGNRNYPGLQWGQVALGNNTRKAIALKAGSENYPGDYAGSENETHAMMKWFYHYVIVEKAIIHLDYHQQGRLIYAGKPWQTKQQFSKSKNLANQITKILSPYNSSYRWKSELSSYGLDGNGSTATDYSTSLAVGGKFSPAYGFMTFVSDGHERTLMEVKDLDTTKYKIAPSNTAFASATIEIGSGTSSLGYSSATRKLLAKEYTTFHFDQLLEKLPRLIEDSE